MLGQFLHCNIRGVQLLTLWRPG